MKKLIITASVIGPLVTSLLVLSIYREFTVGSRRDAELVPMVRTHVTDFGVDLLIPAVFPFHSRADDMFRAYTSDPDARTPRGTKAHRFTPKHMTLAETTNTFDEIVRAHQESYGTDGQISIRRIRGLHIAVIKKDLVRFSYTTLLTVISGERDLSISIQGPLRGVHITPMLLARIAESATPIKSGEQDIRQVSPEAAPSASPDEPSM